MYLHGEVIERLQNRFNFSKLIGFVFVKVTHFTVTCPLEINYMVQVILIVIKSIKIILQIQNSYVLSYILTFSMSR